MIFETGSRRIAVLGDEPSATYGVQEGSGNLRRYVELRVAAGGLMPRSGLGGTLRAGTRPLRLEVQGSGDAGMIDPTTVSHLSKPLCPGLPDQFVAVVEATLAAGLSGGTVTIDRAAYDPVDSSVRSFYMTTVILAAVLAHDAEHGAADDAQLTELLERLPVDWGW